MTGLVTPLLRARKRTVWSWKPESDPCPLGSAQTREFSIRSEALSPAQLLRTATVNPARMLRCEDRLGQIKPGFIANLLILDSNPLEDITILDKPGKYLLAVMKEGRAYHSRWSKLTVDSPPPVPLIE
jgi:imidazolonepropionase-like amidohydrolase